jgi:hypothetical protein
MHFALAGRENECPVMPIHREGWELHVERLGIHRRGSLARTYGRYRVSVDGVLQQGLTGFMVETTGPGDNSQADNGRRIAAGQYPLTTHYRAYVSAGYSPNTTTVADLPMPAIRLLETGARTGILVHPVYPPGDKLYVASVGCLNPTAALDADQNVEFWDSRARVIALIESLRAFRREAFSERAPTRIEGARIVIEGEPMGSIRPTTEFEVGPGSDGGDA